MSKFQKHHDVSSFCGKEGSKYAFHCVKYDDTRKLLAASDNAVAIVVPFDGNGCPETLLPAESVKKAASGSESLNVSKSGSIRLDNKAVKVQTKKSLPDIVGAMPTEDPDIMFPVSVEAFQKLIAYAKENGVENFHIGFNHAEGDSWKKRTVDKPMRFMMDVPSGDKSVLATGVIMPCEAENQRAVAARLRQATKIGNGSSLPSEDDKPSGKPVETKKKKAGKASSNKPTAGRKPKAAGESNGKPLPKNAGDAEIAKDAVDRVRKFLADNRPIIARRWYTRAATFGTSKKVLRELDKAIVECKLKKFGK